MAKAKGTLEVERADAIFAALAHPARRQVLLSVHYRGSCNAGAIANRFDCSWPTMSRHLATLVASGLLVMQKVGRERVYTVDRKLLRDSLAEWASYFEDR